MPRNILISEIFGPTIQGEGALIGRPTVFVRTASCDYRCAWCDTDYAVKNQYKEEWIKKSATEILTIVETLSPKPILITLSGGNPAIQPLNEFIDLAHLKGYPVAMETQGSIAKPWFKKLDYLTLSPKPPSAQIEFNLQNLEQSFRYAEQSETLQLSLKFVISDDSDLQWAYSISNKFPETPVFIQPCLSRNEQLMSDHDLALVMRSAFDSLTNEVFQLNWPAVRILPQLHTLIWGNTRGV